MKKKNENWQLSQIVSTFKMYIKYNKTKRDRK